jgi:hypothetical protein
MTEWKVLKYKNEETNYLINKNGEIKSLYKNKILKPSDNGNGYKQAHIRYKGKRKTVYYHTAVAMTFIPNPENKSMVNHKNFNKEDNRAENLEWVTAKENTNHAFMAGVLRRPPTLKGESVGTSKLKIIQVQAVRYLYPDFTIKEISIIMNMSWSSIKSIVSNKNWSHVMDKKCV